MKCTDNIYSYRSESAIDNLEQFRGIIVKVPTAYLPEGIIGRLIGYNDKEIVLEKKDKRRVLICRSAMWDITEFDRTFQAKAVI